MTTILSLLVIGGAWWVWRVVQWVWFRPRAIEKCLRKQGLNGAPYRLFHEDMKQLANMTRLAATNAKPISFFDDFLPTILPFHHYNIQTYGKNSFAWIGPIARINVMDPELIKEILMNNKIYKKPTPNPLVRFLASGIPSYEDEKWAKHRKILAPAFTQDKLKHMFSTMYTSCNDILVSEWEKLASENGSCDLDVQPYIDDFTSDVISRNAFGSSYEQGRKIYRLQKEQAKLTSKVLQSIYLPGRRFLPTKTNKRMKEIDNELKSILRKLVEKRECLVLSRENDDHEDLLSLLLKSTMTTNRNMGMSVDDILVSEWEKLASENGSCDLDVQPYIDDFTSDVISRNAFGSSYEQGRKIYRLQKEQAKLTSKVLQSIYLPGRRFLPTKTNKRMKEIDNELKSILRKLMEKRECLVLSRENDDHEDLLSLLLKSTMTTNRNMGMSVDEAIEECKSFYFAGQESSSNLLVWTMIMLSKYPIWQTRAREDVNQVFGHNKPNYEGLNRLKVVTMILNEVLRLYSPGTIFTRVTYTETKLGGLTVPAGVQFLLPVIFVHHDREIWGEDAKEFNPERFSEGIAKATKNKLAFFPFSWGPRICIGNNFALMEAKLAISTILQNFSFELSSSYTHSPSYVVTLQPRYGANLILHKI